MLRNKKSHFLFDWNIKGKIVNKLLLKISAVTLVGSSTRGSGNVFARNPTNGIYGPVCDDSFDLVDVSFFLFGTN